MFSGVVNNTVDRVFLHRRYESVHISTFSIQLPLVFVGLGTGTVVRSVTLATILNSQVPVLALLCNLSGLILKGSFLVSTGIAFSMVSNFFECLSAVFIDPITFFFFSACVVHLVFLRIRIKF